MRSKQQYEIVKRKLLAGMMPQLFKFPRKKSAKNKRERKEGGGGEGREEGEY